MERFDGYWGGAPDFPPVGPACVERVVFRVIPDPLTRAAALRAGEVHIIQAVPLDLVAVLDRAPGVEVQSAPGTRPLWMDMNVTQPLFNDLRVRQALNYAVNKDHLVDEVYQGRGFVLPGPLSPFNNYVNKTIEPYPADRDK